MKKIKAIFVVLVSLFISAIFVSCGNDYKKLEIVYNSESQYVRIVLDKEYWTSVGQAENISSSSQQVEVQFNGIKASKIGDVNIQILPADLAQINSNELVGKLLKFNVSALRSGSGTIVVTHLSSNKNIEIPINIDKKAVSSSSQNKTIVLDIPENGVNNYTIESNKLVSFSPSDATDGVRWKVVDQNGNDTNFNDGISFDETNTVISISSSCDGGEFYLKPILNMKGYEDSIQNYQIKLQVLKLPDTDRIEIESDNAIFDENGKLKLFANNKDYNFADLVFALDGQSIIDNEKMKSIYDFDTYNVVSTSMDGIQVSEIDEGDETKYRISSPIATKQNEWVEFSYEPKDVLGDVKAFKKRIEVDLTKVAEEIKIKEKGEYVSTQYNDETTRTVDITLSDYYAEYKAGQKFNFEVGDVYADVSIKQMQIKIDKKYISKENLVSASTDDSTNVYLLSFTKGANMLKFSISGDYAYSEPFRETDNIYIKYITNNEGTGTDNLTFIVSNIYDNRYGNDKIKDTEKNLQVNINRERGIKALSLTGLYISNGGSGGFQFSELATDKIFYLSNESITKSNDILTDNYATLLDNKSCYGIYIEDIIGGDDSTITDKEIFNLKFAIFKDGAPTDCFELISYVDEMGFNLLQESELKAHWNGKNSKNAICLFKNEGKIVLDGEYTIKMWHEKNGFSTEYSFYIFTNLKDANLNINIKTGQENYGLYYGKDYDSYHDDCIISATNSEILTTLVLGKENASEFIADSSLLKNIKNISITSSVVNNELVEKEGKKSTDYAGFKSDTLTPTNIKSITGENKTLYLNGNINTKNLGTMLDKEVCYIQFTFSLECVQFEIGNDEATGQSTNFYEVSKDSLTVEKKLIMFIYLPVTQAYFNVDGQDYVDYTTAYYYEDLGYYYKNLGEKTLSVKLSTNVSSSENIIDYLTNYEWINPEVSLYDKTDLNSYSASFRFKRAEGIEGGTLCLIKFKIKQFGFSTTIACQVRLENNPVVTQKIVLRNSTNTVNNQKYLYTKVGGKLKFDVEKVGKSDFNEITFIICDYYNKLYPNYSVDEYGNLIDVETEEILSHASDLHIYIVPKEWLSRDVSNSEYSFNNISDFLISQVDSQKYQAVEVYVKIRDGSKNNPLLITNAKELSEAQDSNYYFEIVNDINMSGKSVNLGSFKGNLSSYKNYNLLTKKPDDWDTNYKDYYIYSVTDGFSSIDSESAPAFQLNKYFNLLQNRFTVYNLGLIKSKSSKSLSFIDELTENAELSNIDFRVNFNKVNVDATESSITHVGLVGINNGLIKDVSVETNGTITLNNEAEVYLGGLVAENKGQIKVLNETIVVSSGTLEVKKSDKIYVGGVVGKNTGSIQGILTSNTINGVEYGVLYGEQGAMFNGEFTLSGVASNDNVWTNTENLSYAIGGLVGLNDNGTILNVYVSGKITGVDNVGGVIGANITDDLSSDATNSSNIKNIQSVAKVSGKNRVGGIVGFDYQGCYYHVFYESYEDSKNTEPNIKGTNFVGGLVGYTISGKLNYSYFYSFRWTYSYSDSLSYEDSEYYGKVADIGANQYAGGLIGYAYGVWGTSEGNYSSKIANSCFNGYILAENDCGGLIGFSAGVAGLGNSYVLGAVIYDEDRVYSSIWQNYIDETTSSKGDIYQVISKSSEKINKYITMGTITPITYEGKSIITAIPTSISFANAIKTDIDNEIGTTNFSSLDGEESNLSGVIVLYYYDLMGSTNNNYAFDLQAKNTIKLDDIISKTAINVEPKIGVRLNVTSSNPKVIKILKSGKILLVGEGEATIKFSVMQNSSIADTITIIVRKWTTQYQIYKNSSMTNSAILNEKTINLIKNNSMFIYEKYDETIVNVNNTDYCCQSSQNVLVKYQIVLSKDENTSSSNLIINDNDSNKGIVWDRNSIILKAVKYSSDTNKITLVPYMYLKYSENTYIIEITDEERYFEVNTKEGVKSVNIDVLNATISKADNMDINITIDTDEKIDKLKLEVKVVDQDGNTVSVKDINNNILNSLQILRFNNEELTVNELTLSNDVSNNIQTQKFNLTLNPNLKVEKDLFVNIKFMYEDKYCELDLTIVPQRINSLHAINMKEEATGWDRSSVIRPNVANMIVIEVAPSTAYFDYLEITDLTGSEILKFMQFDSFDSTIEGLGDSKAIRLNEETSSDGYGIRLYKQNTEHILYVYTILGINSEINQTHRIKVTAFSSSGIVLGSTILPIEAVIYPSVILNYYDAKDNVKGKNDSRADTNVTSIDLAIGVEAKISAETINIDGKIEWTFSTNYETTGNPTTSEFLDAFSIVYKNGYYYLKTDFRSLKNKYSSYNEEYFLGIFVNKSITIKAHVSKNTNGHIETATAGFEFVLRRYTINGVSMKSTKDTSNNRVGGVIGYKENIEFYFNETDVSYYKNGTYWRTSYTLGSEDGTMKGLLVEINKLVDGISFGLKVNNDTTIRLGNLTNSFGDLKTIDENKYYYSDNDGVRLIDFYKREQASDKIRLTANKVQVNNYYFVVGLKYEYNNVNIDFGNDGNKVITTDIGINFTEYTSATEYKAIENVTDFNNMVSGQYYILTADLTLENYTPLDIAIAGFDGNGYTININGFNYKQMANSNRDGVQYFGLFKQIYQGAIIKNLIINYPNLHVDFCEYEISSGGYYSTIYFGGICSINLGIITNCQVEGSWTLFASQLSPINFKVAGITAENSQTGYITNTTSEVKISAGGCVAGIACENLGKIATTRFLGSITSYYPSSSAYISTIETAGFVIRNSGEISLSYVKNVALNSSGSIGGFVYENLGNIYDCYLTKINFNSYGQVGGFAYISSGSIKRTYVYSLTTFSGRDMEEFVFTNNSGEYENCYFIMERNVQSDVSGIQCIITSNSKKQSSYNGFIFAETDYGVWSMGENGPELKNSFTKTAHKESIENLFVGSEEIPYVIYDLASFIEIMNLNNKGYLNGYYRVVADIDFELDNPISCDYVFAGKLEGNNMKFSNFCLYSAPGVTSIGLFRGIEQTGLKDGFVRNLKLEPSNIRASSASTVGVLAGYIDSGNIYNIEITGENIVVLGVNAVGGLAGIIKGSFEINGISSNVSVKSNFGQTYNKNSLYLGKYITGSQTENNLGSVSYAGGIAGIVDGYDNRVTTTITLNNYYKITNCKVYGNVVVIGGTVGGAFGVVTERSLVQNIYYNVGSSSYLKGEFVSGGIVGENRGIVKDVALEMDSDKYDLFDANLSGSYANVNGGIVGVNYGGLVFRATTNANVIHSYDLATVGGIVGRNSYGSIIAPSFKGALYGIYAGVVAGADYRFDTISNAGATKGAILYSTRIALPTEMVDYSNIKFDDYIIAKGPAYQNISIDMLNSWYYNETSVLNKISKDIKNFYFEIPNSDATKVDFKFTRVLAGVVGITDKNRCDIEISDNNLHVVLSDVTEEGEIGMKTTSGIVKSTIKSNEIDGEYYSDLQYLLTDNDYVTGGKKLDYYYFVSVMNTTYDFWNSNAGYQEGYVIVLNN